MTHSLSPTARSRKHLQLVLFGTASALVLAALSSTAQAQIAVVCNSDFSNNFSCGVPPGTQAGGRWLDRSRRPGYRYRS